MAGVVCGIGYKGFPLGVGGRDKDRPCRSAIIEGVVGTYNAYSSQRRIWVFLAAGHE